MVLAIAMVSMARERLSLRLMPTPLVRWPMASLYIMPLLLDIHNVGVVTGYGYGLGYAGYAGHFYG